MAQGDRMTGRHMMDILMHLGWNTEDCRRIVIDIPYNDVVTVYREDVGGKKQIADIQAALMEGVHLKVEDIPTEQPVPSRFDLHYAEMIGMESDSE